ncbi:type II secretion system protein [Candidatus Peregrinibacteria bacterium]|jgi:prepilin-type N-terminal cleavage/methylation domain-containing protein|nr:type II secretion system protein [Candidatus Peregrinibacteria bacterium]MBT4632016.1 type II secretion system protein [Candidatus Peregrinibacteria bacterium]MBT5516326.1 type II secretion system protein [Candidatus Peregrinibacteria bacterium]MBT5824396.1 type II secretion system protein [Candidatus Peregrinibacteria bacterium]
MKQLKSKPAFTLIEMTISITVFTIFIGFSMATYISFHRAQQEAAATRSLLMELDSVMNIMTSSLLENKIDYDYYALEGDHDALRAQGNELLADLSLLGSDALQTSVLALRSSDGNEQIIFKWFDGVLTMQKFDEEGAQDGYMESDVLHSLHTNVDYMNFEIFPGKDPYDLENSKEDNLQYQPIVQLNLTLSSPGRVRDRVVLDLQTSITSRFYR